MKKLLLSNVLALLACLLCSMSAEAQEAYACYTSADSTLTFYYDDLRSTRVADKDYSISLSGSTPTWCNDGTAKAVALAVFDPSFADARPRSTSNWFRNMNNLRSITDIEYLNTSETTAMNRMFMNCRSLTTLDLSSFNTQNVDDFGYMFCDSEKITSLDVSNFNTANATKMEHMFGGLVR